MREIYIDELTSCYNRRFLHNWIDNEIKRATRFATKFGLILLDIDDFREINNSFGHLEGDRVLIQLSEFLRSIIREVDNLVRYGGDEFVILMPNTDERGAVELAQRVLNNLNEREISNHRIRCSMGFAVFPKDGIVTEALIKLADNLMYQAKKNGKNRIGIKQEIIKKLIIPAPVTVGRDDEANWCSSQLNDYPMLLISGAAGIGKTRLVSEIKKHTGKSIMLRGNCYAAIRSVAHHPFKDLFYELVARDFQNVQNIYRDLPDIHQNEIVKLMPAGSIAHLVSSDSLDKYRFFNAVGDFLNRLADTLRPGLLLIFLDDVHWIDQPSCELLDFLLRSCNRNVKVIATYRIEEIKGSAIAQTFGIWAREKMYTQLNLLPLKEDQTRKMMESIMGSVPPGALRYVYRQSGGNPFFIEELLRDLERNRKLYWDGQKWILNRKLDDIIPSTIDETIKRKIEFLDRDLRKFIEIAAAYGQEFNVDIIALASQRNVGQMLDAFDELQYLGFIKSRGSDRYFFSEDIVRQIVYRNISRSNLINYHRQIGEAIETIHTRSVPNYYEELANHFTIANISDKALYYSRMAGQKAKHNYAHDHAIKYFENALKFEDRIEKIFELKLELIDTYTLTGDYRKAIEQLEACIKINPNAHQVYQKYGKVCENTGDYKKSLALYETGEKLTIGTEAVYSFQSDIAWLYTRMGKYREAEKKCEMILKYRKRLNRQTLGDVYIIVGVINLRLGKLDKAEQEFQKALKIRTTSGDKKRIAACYLDIGISYADRFKFKMAKQNYEKALAIYQEIGYQEGILLSYNNLGVLHASQDLNAAEDYYLKALGSAKLIGARRTLTYLHNNLAGIEFNLMMLDGALSNYQQALKIAKEMNFHEGIIFANLGLSEICREIKKHKTGQKHLDAALKEADKMKMKYLNIDCMKEQIEYFLLAGQIAKAENLAKKIMTQSKIENITAYKIDNLIYQAKIKNVQKQYKKTHNYLDRAQVLIKPLNEQGLKGRLLYLKGLTYKKEGRLKEAMQIFAKAGGFFKTIGNLRYLDYIEKEIGTTKI